jgi:putative addiction module antidote
MVELKVRKIGNSLGIVLPKEVILRLGAKNGDRVYLMESPDGGYRLGMHDPDFAEKMAKVRDIAARYRNTLRALSK